MAQKFERPFPEAECEAFYVGGAGEGLIVGSLLLAEGEEQVSEALAVQDVFESSAVDEAAGELGGAAFRVLLPRGSTQI